MDTETLRTHARDFLSGECPPERALARLNGDTPGIDGELWRALSELGWPALAIAEDNGGLGLGIEALAAHYEELGYAVAPVPFLSTNLAAQALAGSRGEWLGRIAGGAVGAVMDPLAEPLSLALEGDVVRLTGATGPLVDAADAEIVVLLAKDANGAMHRVVCEPATDGVTFAPTRLYDSGHTMSEATLDLTLPAARTIPASAESEAALLSHAALGCAAEAIGGCDRLLEITIEYLNTRQQFGRAIGSFQALKHRVADHKTDIEAARRLVAAATRRLAEGHPLGASDASAAKALACATYVELGRDSVQLHGGIGFTSEHVAHAFVKRAWLLDAVFGDRKVHEAIAARHVLEAAA